MTQRERQGWSIVAGLWVILFLIFGGGYNVAGVFVTPLIKQFGWSRAQVSGLQSVLAVSAGISAPLVGWLLDRIEARMVMVVGALMAAAAYFWASQVHSYGPMLAAYLLLGLGIGCATLLPAALVVSNWFSGNRGIALGLTLSGTALGGAGMTIVANLAIGHHGWRGGYVTLAIPMIVIAIPIMFLMVRSRPPEARATSALSDMPTQPVVELPGFELGEASHTRSFWLICGANFLYAFIAASAGLHLIPYLIGIGYTATFSARMMSLVLVLAGLGKLVMGAFADRVSARRALAWNFVAQGIGVLLIFGAARAAVIIPFVLIFGLSLGAPLVLLPMITVESLGLKRFGSIAGTSGVFQTIGAAVGPVAAGRIFDVMGSYSYAFDSFIVAAALGVVVTLGCLTLETEQSRMMPAKAVAA